MAVRADKPLNERTLLSTLDVGARQAMKRAQAAVMPVVLSETPHGRTGQVAQALRPRLSKTQTGQALTVAPPRGRRHGQSATISEVVRWVNRGTGIHRTAGTSGTPARRIRSKRPFGRMTLPGGRKVWSVAGQRPNPFIDRIRMIATPRVQRALEEGARTAARAVERQIGH